ncbi:MAG: energy-coupling factor ABC transporter ATP-binding protein [Clostridiales bacterium]|jgi:energy-coupling factor transport system ATP-binding protein|nr:energy-coupling factor ABC transporter ATP-binding protein [Clostridiales bacterium]
MLRLDGVHFSYNTEGQGIQDVSFELKSGEFAAIIGENGAGKSTICRLCNGLLKPSSGTVTVAGFDTSNAKTSRIARDVGFLFQNPDRQLCQSTVREEIMFGMGFAGVSEAEERCSEMLELFGLDGKKEPFGLSRGERQLVALASVLAREPGLMILDEPTTGLDYMECTRIMDHITRLNENGTTVLMVSHDMEVVLDYAHRGLVLSGGRLIGDGSVHDIMRDAALLSKASLLPAQIPALAVAIGGRFIDIDRADDMASIVEAEANALAGDSRGEF